MTRRGWLVRVLTLCGALLVLPAAAHKASDSYLGLDVQAGNITGQWDIALRDIDFAIGLDADGNGEISWGEVQVKHPDIAVWALQRLSVRRGGECRLAVTEQLIDAHTDGNYAVLKFTGTCAGSSQPLEVDYRLLFDIDALHRGLLRLDLDGVTQSAVLAPGAAQLTFKAGETSRLAQFGQYLVQGVWHIWIGFDHILFLLALLLPAVLVYERKAWRGADSLRSALTEVLWVVTAFTVAHSMTLSLAALEMVSLPSRWVESAIAASVVLAAANNLKPMVSRRRWLVAFVFGLIHGFGFASVLAELGLPTDALVLSLVGFNAGVELGQLAIVAVFLPMAFVLRNTALYRQGILVGGSFLTLILALLWLAERVLNLKLLGT